MSSTADGPYCAACGLRRLRHEPTQFCGTPDCKTMTFCITCVEVPATAEAAPFCDECLEQHRDEFDGSYVLAGLANSPESLTRLLNVLREAQDSPHDMMTDGLYEAVEACNADPLLKRTSNEVFHPSE